MNDKPEQMFPQVDTKINRRWRAARQLPELRQLVADVKQTDALEGWSMDSRQMEVEHGGVLFDADKHKIMGVNIWYADGRLSATLTHQHRNNRHQLQTSLTWIYFVKVELITGPCNSKQVVAIIRCEKQEIQRFSELKNLPN